MSAIVHHATVITPQGAALRVLPGHSLVFDSGRITELAPAATLQPRLDRGEFDHVLNGTDRIVIPGLINTHHHLYQALTRCLPEVQNARLFDWLLGLYQRWRAVDFAAVEAAARCAIAELLLHGCTTTNDHFYLFPPRSDVRLEAVLGAATDLGIRIHLCRGSMTVGRSRGGLPPDELVENDEDVLRDCARALDAYHDPAPHALRRIDLAPCSPFNVSTGLLRDTLALARERGVLLHTHLAETLDEERYCLDRFGCRPVQYLAKLGWLGPDVYLAHVVHLSNAEIATLAQTDTAVAHCPTSNLRLGSGIAPLRALLAAGVRVGLAVDGSSSNDGGNLLAEAKQALLLARLSQTLDDRRENAAPNATARSGEPPGHAQYATHPPLFAASTALRLATAGGAALLRRPELGHLNPGAAADFAVFRTNDVALAGAAVHDPAAALVLCDAPRAEHVFVAGRPVVRDGRLAQADEHVLAENLNASVRRLG